MRHRDNRKVFFQLGAIVIIVGLLLGGIYKFGRWFETHNEPEVRGDYRSRYAQEGLLEYRGKNYRPRKNMTTILVMGIDRVGDSPVEHGARRGGQADFLRLLIIDRENKNVSQIAIDRDTMTPITILGVLGERSGMRTAQISLSHAFGDGRDESCRLTKEAVSNFLLQTPIDFYMAMDMSGISVLNDFLGGVTVTLEDDFSEEDASMTMGKTITLHGDQAELFVRGRRNIGEKTNESRMKRQEQYLSQMMKIIVERQQQDPNFIGEMYDAVAPYMVTDISRGQMLNEAAVMREYSIAEAVHIVGSHKIGTDGFMEFWAEEDELKKLIVDLFYTAIE